MGLQLSITVFMGILIVYLPRRFAIVPFIIVALYMPIGQTLMIGSLDFPMYRIMLIFGWARIIFRKEISSFKINKIDKVFIFWILISVINYTLLYSRTSALINRLGFAYDTAGAYFLFRIFIQNMDDINFIIKILAIIIVPLAIEMLIEYNKGRNLFSTLGGVPEISTTRYGRVRSQGSFGYPILAGTFGATLIPLFVSLWFRNLRMIAIIGLISATIIAFTAGSSGAIIAYLAGIVGLLMWYFKENMRTIRYGIILLLIVTALFMNAPIFYLPARLSSIMGGTGWHRSYLMHQAFSHLNEWWLIGTKVTSHWMPISLAEYPDSADITSQYIGEGVSGGLIKMILFIVIIVLCFKNIGKVLAAMKEKPIPAQITIWSLGVMLFAHVMSFISIFYQDQIKIFYYLTIASISTLSIYNHGDN